MQKQIADWEVITDPKHILSLADIHESLEWFASSVRDVLVRLPDSIRRRLKMATVEVILPFPSATRLVGEEK